MAQKKTKKKQFEIFAKNIPNFVTMATNPRTTFCSFRYGELMAKKWLDSTEKQNRRSNACDRHTDRQTESTAKNNKTPS